VLGAVLETGDKARMEVVRLLAREFRGYLEAMEVHKDIHHLLTNYSLEIKASVHLSPKEEAKRGSEASVKLEPRGTSDDA